MLAADDDAAVATVLSLSNSESEIFLSKATKQEVRTNECAKGE
jgi:hypothetical protein